jgi:hypothetical protein
MTAMSGKIEFAPDLYGAFPVPPDASSSNKRLQPAALSALACRTLFCSSPLDTRA